MLMTAVGSGMRSTSPPGDTADAGAVVAPAPTVDSATADATGSGTRFTVNASDDRGIDRIVVLYRATDSPHWASTTLTQQPDDSWSNGSRLLPGKTVEYIVQAVSFTGHVGVVQRLLANSAAPPDVTTTSSATTTTTVPDTTTTTHPSTTTTTRPSTTTTSVLPPAATGLIAAIVALVNKVLMALHL
jgi:hypothetical protein